MFPLTYVPHPESGRSEEHHPAKLPAVTLEVICNKHVWEGLTMTPPSAARLQPRPRTWPGKEGELHAGEGTDRVRVTVRVLEPMGTQGRKPGRTQLHRT